MKKNKFITLGLISLSTLLFVGCANTDNGTSPSSVTSSNSSESREIEKKDTPGKTEANTTNISLDEAIVIYQKEYPNTDITALSFDTSFNKWYYDIEGINDTTEFELQIDALTGEVSREKEHELDKDEMNPTYRENEKLNLDGLISIDEASQIALTAIGSGEATDFDLDKELNLTYWAVTVQDGNKEHEVKIDAQTKDILETELDD